MGNDSTRVPLKWINSYSQSEEYLWRVFCVLLAHLSWRYLLHLCLKGVMRLNLIKACEVLWRGKEVSVVCCYFILMCLWASVFYLGSGIEELTKFVLCISRSEGVVYFQYNKYFQAIIEAWPTASFNQLDFVLKKKLQQKSRNTTPSKPHASTEGGAPI